MRIAVLDLGTNTFNLLIVEVSDDKRINVIISTKRAVKLGFGGINNGVITNEAFERGINAVKSLNSTIRKYKAETVYAFATSAIRSAKNGGEFAELIKNKFCIEIRVITGDKEAELIYKGVKLIYEFSNEPVLILDIGGGSNELIIANKDRIFWKRSFNLGVARLLERFNPSEPITNGEIELIDNYLEIELKSLFDACKEIPVSTLVGSSGSFESFVAMTAFRHKLKDSPVCELSLNHFEEIFETLRLSTIDQRKRMKGLVLMRVEMIVLAAVFTKFIVKRLGIEKIIKSDFSLKEGVIAEMIFNND